jgi:hypothetical protein
VYTIRFRWNTIRILTEARGVGVEFLLDQGKNMNMREVKLYVVSSLSKKRAYSSSLIILIPSSATNAFKVLVLTFPADPTLSINDITVSSFGASIIITTSYSPKV